MRAVAVLLGLGLLVAGCGSDEGSGPPWHDGVEPAAAAATIGGTGSACPLPVTLSLAEDWKPKAQTVEENTRGPQVACAVDAKPAGHVGFLRVYLTPGPEAPKTALQELLTHDKGVEQVQYRDAAPGLEQTYVTTTSEYSMRNRAYALPLARHTVVLTLGAFDDDEYVDMLPAYLLAVHSMKPA